jgi:ATP-dependent helicase IRC3
MLVLAHREELIDQAMSTLTTHNPALRVTKEMAECYADPTADVVVASVATLGRKNTKRLERFAWDSFSLVIVDEAHHSTADSYKNIFDAVGLVGKLLVGVTATPKRSDGITLTEVYDKFSYVYPIRQAIQDGWLASPRGYRITTTTTLEGLEVSGGDFVQSKLAGRVNTPERNQFIVKAWKTHAENRRTIIFAVDIQHAQDMAKCFNAEGISTQAVWGDDPARKEKLERHQNGEYPILVNVGIALEGYDDPRIACVVVARPTESSLVYQQAVGRGLRIAEGKQDCVVLDVCDNCTRHSLITLPTLMGLSNVLDLKGHELLDVVEQLELVQIEHPSIDLSTLKDIDELQAIVKAIDLFEVRFPKETEENSEFIWMRAVDGGYRINIPKDGPEKSGFMRIYENPLGSWSIKGQIKEVDLEATRPTMEEAFKASDEQIRKRLGKMRVSYLLREATWHNKKVTPGQMKMLTRLFPHRQFPYNSMTSGMASKMIAERLNKKA